MWYFWLANRSKRLGSSASEPYLAFAVVCFRYVGHIRILELLESKSKNVHLLGNAVRHPNRFWIAAGTGGRAVGPSGTNAYVATKQQPSTEELEFSAGAGYRVTATEKRSLIANGETGLFASWNDHSWLGSVHSQSTKLNTASR